MEEILTLTEVKFKYTSIDYFRLLLLLLIEDLLLMALPYII